MRPLFRVSHIRTLFANVFPSLGPRPAPNRQSGPKRVLIVECDHGVARTLSLLFSLRGCECRAVVSCKEAIALAAQWAPDTAILDLILSDMPGLHAADSLRRTHGCQIIMLYAQAAPPLVEDAERRGYPVLRKPVPPEILLRTAGMMPTQP